MYGRSKGQSSIQSGRNSGCKLRRKKDDKENLIGKGFGETKKQIATDFIINALPSFLLPFKSVIKRLLSDVLDLAVELAVEKLHSIQKSLPETV